MAALSPDDVDGYINTLQSGECINERSLKRLCSAVSELLIEESNVQPVRSPVTVRFFSRERYFVFFPSIFSNFSEWIGMCKVSLSVR